MRTHLIAVVAQPAAVLALLATQAAFAGSGSIQIIDTDRTTSAFVIVPPCGDTLSDNDEAVGLDPFDSTANAQLVCEAAGGVATGVQSSEITQAQSVSFVASGVATSASSVDDGFTVIHAIAGSSFEITFSVDFQVGYSIEGDIGFAISPEPGGLGANTLVKLTGPGEQVIFQQSLSPSAGNTSAAAPIHTAGVLQPGTYTLSAHAQSVIDSTTPPNLDAEASFDFTFQLPVADGNLGDLNDDGLVNAADLALLLGSWGECPGCAADVNNDGVVNAADLALLLGNWT